MTTGRQLLVVAFIDLVAGASFSHGRVTAAPTTHSRRFPLRMTGTDENIKDDLPQLPSKSSAARGLEVDGDAVQLDELGPIVVTEDGQMRRIANWSEMTPEERVVTQRRIAQRNAKRLKRLRGGAIGSVTRGTFSHGGFECAFRRKAAAPGYETAAPLLLVHPIGIGLAGWFWDRFLESWAGAEVFVPDLIGCGGSEAWEPSARGMFVPLDWERQIECLWREHVRRPAVIVSQGGLAPVAIRLAARDTDAWRGSRAVQGLVLASPPEFGTLCEGLDDAEVERNFEQLGRTLGSNTTLGTLAYRALASRPFVRLFSDAFLFAGAADERFLAECAAEAVPERRWPVLAFNAGLVVCTRPAHVHLHAPLCVCMSPRAPFPRCQCGPRGVRVLGTGIGHARGMHGACKRHARDMHGVHRM